MAAVTRFAACEAQPSQTEARKWRRPARVCGSSPSATAKGLESSSRRDANARGRATRERKRHSYERKTGASRARPSTVVCKIVVSAAWRRQRGSSATRMPQYRRVWRCALAQRRSQICRPQCHVAAEKRPEFPSRELQQIDNSNKQKNSSQQSVAVHSDTKRQCAWTCH